MRIDHFSMQVNGAELIRDCTIELNHGRRYGLLGQNGCGKSNLLAALANREVSSHGYCSPRHQTHSEPSFVELNDIL